MIFAQNVFFSFSFYAKHLPTGRLAWTGWSGCSAGRRGESGDDEDDNNDNDDDKNDDDGQAQGQSGPGCREEEVLVFMNPQSLWAPLENK